MPEKSDKPNPAWPMRLLWVLFAVAFLAMLTWGDGKVAAPRVDYSQLVDWVETDRVERVVLQGSEAQATLLEEETVGEKTTKRVVSHVPDADDELVPLLREHGVAIAVEPPDDSVFPQMLILLLPWVLILGAWFWLSNRAQRMMGGGGGGPLGGQWKPKRRIEPRVGVETTFEDVAGADGAKADLQEVVSFLRDPERFQALGGRMPRGVLLVGPPGTGKTLLARAVAGQAGVPFFSITGSEFIEMFVGVGASRVRELFAEARKNAPAILFIDEIDAVGRSRGTGLGGGHDEREQTLNQLLAEMDGFDRDERTVVMAATNRPDVLDPALLRPGRFDRRVVVELPAQEARRAILAVHVRQKPLGEDVDLDRVAQATPGFSGADLASVVNEAALAAFRRHATTIDARDFSEALDKVQLGNPRESHLTDAEKERVAIHEAGHTLVAARTDGAIRPSRVSILPRGMALGQTQQRPPTDRHLQTRTELLARLRVLMGGYAAERLHLGEVSTGAEDDLKQAAELALRMVAHLGMSDTLGPVYHDQGREHPFLGQRIATDGGASDVTRSTLEKEAQALMRSAEADAERMLEEHRERHRTLVAALIEHETLEDADLARILEPPAAAAA